MFDRNDLSFGRELDLCSIFVEPHQDPLIVLVRHHHNAHHLAVEPVGVCGAGSRGPPSALIIVSWAAEQLGTEDDQVSSSFHEESIVARVLWVVEEDYVLVNMDDRPFLPLILAFDNPHRVSAGD